MDMALKEHLDSLERQIAERDEALLLRDEEILTLRNEVQLLLGQVYLMRADREYTAESLQ